MYRPTFNFYYDAESCIVIGKIDQSGARVAEMFQTVYKNLVGLLFCKPNKSDSPTPLGVCLNAKADDGRCIGVYSASLSMDERVFLCNLLQALGWQLSQSDSRGEEVFSRWRNVLIFGKIPNSAEECVDADDLSGEVIARQIKGQEKKFVFLPALADIMQSGVIKKRVWSVLNQK